jgi:hypothetical protein
MKAGLSSLALGYGTHALHTSYKCNLESIESELARTIRVLPYEGTVGRSAEVIGSATSWGNMMADRNAIWKGLC